VEYFTCYQRINFLYLKDILSPKSCEALWSMHGRTSPCCHRTPSEWLANLSWLPWSSLHSVTHFTNWGTKMGIAVASWMAHQNWHKQAVIWLSISKVYRFHPIYWYSLSQLGTEVDFPCEMILISPVVHVLLVSMCQCRCAIPLQVLWISTWNSTQNWCRGRTYCSTWPLRSALLWSGLRPKGLLMEIW